MKTALKYFEAFRSGMAIIISILTITLIIFFISDQPIDAIRALVLGPVSGLRKFGNVIEMMIPLTFCGLAVCVMFQANQFNMVAEGSFFIGAVAASMIAIYIPLPPVMLPLFILAAGILVGALVAMIPAVLKIKTGSTEIVVSLMLNYIIVLLGKYLLINVMRDPASGSGASYAFQSIAKLPVLIPGTRIHAGLVLLAVVVVLTVLFLYKSRKGYEIRITGQNEKCAVFSGVGVSSAILLSQAVGGGLAGLGGSVEMMGMYPRFSWLAGPGYGWDGIIICILAKQNPVFAPVAAFFLAYLRIGADTMAMTTDVPAEIISVVQATILLLLAAQLFLSKFKHKLIFREAMAQTKGGKTV